MNLPSLGPRGEGWLLGQVLLFLAVAGAALVTGSFGQPGGLWSGLALIAAGLGVAGRGVVDLGTNLSVFPRPKGGAALVEHGIYRIIRHPIYAGLVLVAAGLALARWSLAGAALSVALALFLDLKARREETLLAARFPGYAAYARRTRRFVPRIY